MVLKIEFCLKNENNVYSIIHIGENVIDIFFCISLQGTPQKHYTNFFLNHPVYEIS